MSPEQQRIAIAEACGITVGKPYDDGTRWCDSTKPFVGSWKTSSSPERWHGSLPHYTEDLNAIHEAEKVLTIPQSEQYAEQLVSVIDLPDHAAVTARGAYLVAHATAAQRSEALLRTLNLWHQPPADAGR